MNRIIKPRGHVQERYRKDAILAFLDTTPCAVTRTIAIAIGLTDRPARAHLCQLLKSGEIERLDLDGYRTRWCLPANADVARNQLILQPVERFVPRPGDLARIKADQENVCAVDQARVPVGAWRVDHCIAARSVFDLARTGAA